MSNLKAIIRRAATIAGVVCPWQVLSSLICCLAYVFSTMTGVIGFGTEARAEDFVIGTAEAAANPVLEPSYQFDIPPKPLEGALNAYSAATGVQILYDAHLMNGRSSPGVHGFFTQQAALQNLLTGTGLISVRLFSHGYTLTQSSAVVQFSAGLPTKAPILKLDPLRVVTSSEDERRLYAMTVQFAIQKALQKHHDLRRQVYKGDLVVWVSSLGAIGESTFLVSTGDLKLDAAIVGMVRGIEIGKSPPEGLPQPVHVRVLTETAQR